MKHSLENNKLTIFLEGEINSYNSEVVEKEINETISQSEFKSLALDFEKLHYTSSAGLRIIVMLKQRYGDLTLVRVPDGVFDVFEMVGLPNLIKIERLQ